jgi:hypothetical protein
MVGAVSKSDGAVAQDTGPAEAMEPCPNPSFSAVNPPHPVMVAIRTRPVVRKYGIQYVKIAYGDRHAPVH